MKLLLLFVLAMFVSAGQAGPLNHDKPKPEQPPVVIERTKTNNDAWVVAGALAVGLIGVVVWCNTKDEKGREKKVELAPVPTANGEILPMLRAKAVF